MNIISYNLAKKLVTLNIQLRYKLGTESSLYDKEGKHTIYCNYGMMYSGLSDGYIYAPTLSQLQTYLREKGIHINPFPFRAYPDDKITGYFCGEIYNNNGKLLYEGDETFNTYEQALEFGLEKGLNLI